MQAEVRPPAPRLEDVTTARRTKSHASATGRLAHHEHDLRMDSDATSSIWSGSALAQPESICQWHWQLEWRPAGEDTTVLGGFTHRDSSSVTLKRLFKAGLTQTNARGR